MDKAKRKIALFEYHRPRYYRYTHKVQECKTYKFRIKVGNVQMVNGSRLWMGYYHSLTIFQFYGLVMDFIGGENYQPLSH